MGSTNRAVLHGLTRHTDALSMVFLPSSVCEVCGEEFVNRIKLHNNNLSKEGSLCGVASPGLLVSHVEAHVVFEHMMLRCSQSLRLSQPWKSSLL